MKNGELKDILGELVSTVAFLEEQIRSLEVLTSHRVDHSLSEKLGIPQKTNALHIQVQSLRARVNKLNEKKDSLLGGLSFLLVELKEFPIIYTDVLQNVPSRLIQEHSRRRLTKDSTEMRPTMKTETLYVVYPSFRP
jgi:hypothetical protein